MMVRAMKRIGPLLVLVGSLVLFGSSLAGAAAGTPEVTQLHLSGVVDPFEARYIEGGVAAAADRGDAAVLITIDTPGGLDSSMRQIVKAILNSPVPVICYTSPSGARAASAGTFVMLSCPIAAMAPGTNIGAAHPVGVSGAIESEKVTNDAAAFIRSLAERWGRNADWAEQAVRDSVSVSAEEALRLHVVDLVSPSASALFTSIDAACGGGSSPVLGADRCPATTLAGAEVVTTKMGIGASILHGLLDPNLAFLFFFVGLVLIVVELLHPGVSVPGVLGVLMLVSAFLSFGFLPVQLAGIVFLIASAVFFLLELKHPGIGVPTVGGVLFLVLGGLLLFDPSVPNARVSPWLIGGLAVALALFFGIAVKAGLAARHLPPGTGLESMIGERGVALDDLAPSGRVRAGREVWSAEALAAPIPAGSTVRIEAIRGLHLIVEQTMPPMPEHLPTAVGAGEKESR